jgi:hypothetical protein
MRYAASVLGERCWIVPRRSAPVSASERRQPPADVRDEVALLIARLTTHTLPVAGQR